MRDRRSLLPASSGSACTCSYPVSGWADRDVHVAGSTSERFVAALRDASSRTATLRTIARQRHRARLHQRSPPLVHDVFRRRARRTPSSLLNSGRVRARGRREASCSSACSFAGSSSAPSLVSIAVAVRASSALAFAAGHVALVGRPVEPLLRGVPGRRASTPRRFVPASVHDDVGAVAGGTLALLLPDDESFELAAVRRSAGAVTAPAF